MFCFVLPFISCLVIGQQTLCFCFCWLRDDEEIHRSRWRQRQPLPGIELVRDKRIQSVKTMWKVSHMWLSPGDKARTRGLKVAMLVEVEETGVERFTLDMYYYLQHTINVMDKRA
jgi:hypothetical protein